jgi:hypothetical protein
MLPFSAPGGSAIGLGNIYKLFEVKMHFKWQKLNNL